MTLTVKVEYLHHKRRHWSWDEAERERQARISEEARMYEGEIAIAAPELDDDYTSDDFVTAIDRIRAQMPVDGPRGADDWWRRRMPAGVEELGLSDSFEDGRRLEHLHLNSLGPVGQQRFCVWFSTAAGYSASFTLPTAPPGGALADLAMSADQFFHLRLDLNRRAIAGRARALAGRVERLRAPQPIEHRMTRREAAARRAS